MDDKRGQSKDAAFNVKNVPGQSIDKRCLIRLVRDNPILWDSRLPRYKRSNGIKLLKWKEIGQQLNVSGERVKRSFTSLREIFRRELYNERAADDGKFKSRWSLYSDMGYLKAVIRERKSRKLGNKTTTPVRTQVLCQDQQQEVADTTINLDIGGIDEYQYFAPNDPANPSNTLLRRQGGSSLMDTSSTSGPVPACESAVDSHISSIMRISLSSDSAASSKAFSLSQDNIVAENLVGTLQQLKKTHPNKVQASPLVEAVIKTENNFKDFPTDRPAKRTSTELVSGESEGGGPSTREQAQQTDLNGTFILRETLYHKFGEFVAVRMASLSHEDASRLMNRILSVLIDR